MAVLLSVQKSLDSVILKLAPSPGVNSATKPTDVSAHYCEQHQHPWLIYCQGRTHNKIHTLHCVKQKQPYRCLTVESVLQKG